MTTMTTTQPTTARPRVRSALLDGLDWLTWGLTGRRAGLGAADGNIGYSGDRDRADAWAMRQHWLGLAGLAAGDLVITGQVHGTAVLRVHASHTGAGARPGAAIAGIADAQMTDEPGPILFSAHADCLPIVLADPARRAVAVVHAGWRGTVAGVAPTVVAAMTAAYGSRPGDLLAFLGPAISGPNYEVGPEVVAAWRRTAAPASAATWPSGGDRWRFDAATANAELLLRAGLTAHHIEQSRICTFANQEHWFSHRAQGPATGRFAVFATIRHDADGASR